MNISLKSRVATSFIIANLVVIIISLTVFHFLNSLNKDIESITIKSNKVSVLTDEIRISAVTILKYQRRILTKKGNAELVDKILNLCESFTSQLQSLEGHYLNDKEITGVIKQMLSYIDSLKIILGKSTLSNRGSRIDYITDNSGIASVGELADKILESFSEFQDIQYVQSIERNKKIESIIDDTKKNMMIALIIGFLGTIILGLVVPGKIALPFKKIKDAIRELQECNFDVSIYYNQDDEIGEIATEMNKMIHSFKVFEELRTDRISVENRKFNALANLVKKPVLVANAEGQLMYMNNQLYSLLQVQSEDIIGKVMTETIVPTTIIETYELAIKRRSKIENAEIVILPRESEEEKDKEVAENDEVHEEVDEVGEEVESVLEPLFSGYANVIPIRGKESSLDYYLMVLSKEVFV